MSGDMEPLYDYSKSELIVASASPPPSLQLNMQLTCSQYAVFSSVEPPGLQVNLSVVSQVKGVGVCRLYEIM